MKESQFVLKILTLEKIEAQVVDCPSFKFVALPARPCLSCVVVARTTYWSRPKSEVISYPDSGFPETENRYSMAGSAAVHGCCC